MLAWNPSRGEASRPSRHPWPDLSARIPRRHPHGHLPSSPS